MLPRPRKPVAYVIRQPPAIVHSSATNLKVCTFNMMPLFIGQVLKGRTASYVITKILKVATVFQAKIVPRSHSSQNDSADLPSTLYDDTPLHHC